MRYRILAAAEAVGIRLDDPLLYTQKQFIQPLHLPWPKHHPSAQSNSSEQLYVWALNFALLELKLDNLTWKCNLKTYTVSLVKCNPLHPWS